MFTHNLHIEEDYKIQYLHRMMCQAVVVIYSVAGSWCDISFKLEYWNFASRATDYETAWAGCDH